MISGWQNKELIHYLENLLGKEYPAFMETAPELPAVRINPLKENPASFEKFLKRIGQNYRRIPFNPDGYQLAEDNLPLSHTLKFFMGHFQYQSAASQLPVILLDAHPGERILDMTAAPGSKSSQLAGMMENQGELILNDSSRSRHQPLNVNMQRSGAVNYYVLNAWGERMGSIFPEYFDKILLDAPCSALGTIQSNPGIKEWWSIDRVLKLSRVQYQLLVSAVKALKVGGELVYSTCSITPQENEMVINRLLAEYPLQIIAPPEHVAKLFSTGLTEFGTDRFNPQLSAAIRIWPQRQQMEGFFVVKLVKQDSVKKAKQNAGPNFEATRPADDPAILAILTDLEKNWGIDTARWQNFRFVLTSTRLWLVNNFIQRVVKSRFIFAGLLLAAKRLFGWKLLNGSAQVLAEYITRRRIRLDTQTMKILFKTGKITIPALMDGYYTLDYEGVVFACGYSKKGELRISLPHYFNLII